MGTRIRPAIEIARDVMKVGHDNTDLEKVSMAAAILAIEHLAGADPAIQMALVAETSFDAVMN